MTQAAPRVVVLDYGSGNLRSAERALAATGSDVTVTDDPRKAREADGLVVPGVGAFAACMAGLRAVGGDEIIFERVDAGRPVLGICVGHQVLFDRGVEHGEQTEGCGQWPGVVERLQANRLPHMGWNDVDAPADSLLFDGVTDQRFYFVHSYGVHADGVRNFDLTASGRVTWAEHGGDRFVAAIEDGPLSATQFHPEKSGAAGARLLSNWVATL